MIAPAAASLPGVFLRIIRPAGLAFKACFELAKRWSCRESNPMLYLGFCLLSCRFVPSRSHSVPLVTCGFGLGSRQRQERSPTFEASSYRSGRKVGPIIDVLRSTHRWQLRHGWFHSGVEVGTGDFELGCERGGSRRAPRAVAYFNSRVTNPAARSITPWLPGQGTLEHVGRKIRQALSNAAVDFPHPRRLRRSHRG